MMIHKILYSIGIAVILSGCLHSSIREKNIQAHGYVPNVEQIQEMQTRRPTLNQVSSVLGKPFVVGTYDSNYWYYIFFRTEQYAFFKKEIIDFKMVEIKFSNGIVDTVNTFDKSVLQDIAYNTSQSDTGGKSLGFLEQTLGNVGKFRLKQ